MAAKKTAFIEIRLCETLRLDFDKMPLDLQKAVSAAAREVEYGCHENYEDLIHLLLEDDSFVGLLFQSVAVTDVTTETGPDYGWS